MGMGMGMNVAAQVNNYDLVLTVFHERHLPRAATSGFEGLLREQVMLE